MALDVGADSYTSLADANTRIATTRLNAIWSPLEEGVQENYLRDAKRLMDDIVLYPGWPTTSGKPWPRQFVPLRWGIGEYLDQDTTPPEIGEANALQAAAMAIEDRESDDVVETQAIMASDDTRWSGMGGRKVLSDRVRDLLHGSGYGIVREKGDVRVRGLSRG